MNNNPLHIRRSLPVTEVAEVLPLTVVPNSGVTVLEIAIVSAWTGLRDAMATYGASWVGFAATLGARQLTRAVPGTGHVFSALDALAVGTTTYVFASGVGTQGWHPHRRWIGGVASAALTFLLLYTLYTQQDENARDRLATSWFGTAVYSVSREFLQGQGRRIFPERVLDPRRGLHFEGGRNTCKHTVRLIIAVATYTGTSLALSSWAALRNILSSDFSALNQDLGLFAQESSQVFGIRAANEWSDAFIGTMVLALFFRKDIRRGRPWLSNQSAPRMEMATGGISRVSMNLSVNVLQTHLPGAIPVLQGITALRGALLNLKWRPWQPANGRPTVQGGNCLLHAAAGEVLNGRWVCADPPALRHSLGEAIRALADNTENDRVAEGRALVEHHLQQAVQQAHATAGVSGYEAVLDGTSLLRSLPQGLQTELAACTTPEERERVAGTWLSDEAQRSTLLNSVADFYAASERYLPTRVLPCLARLLGRPLALHVGTTDTLYHPEGDGPFEEPVHIQHTVSQQGEAGDHFERVEARSAPRNHAENQSTLRRQGSPHELVSLDVARIEFRDHESGYGDWVGSHVRGGPHNRTPTHGSNPTSNNKASGESHKKNQ